MHPIKFLKPEIAEIIEEMTAHMKDENLIDKLTRLKNMIDLQIKTIYHEGKQYNFYDKKYEIIKHIIENHPERVLLHFATYDPQHTSQAAFLTPISDNFDCITYIRKNYDFNPTAVASVLKRKNSDIEFDLTLVDTYELDNEDSYPLGVKSYLYGNPYDEDWLHVEKTNFSSIDDVIENNK